MTLPAPQHVNQLTAGTKFPSGRPSGAYDCAVASGRMALDAYTHGAIRPSTTEFRAAQDDNDRDGISLSDIARAWRKFGVTFEWGRKAWTTVMARLRAGDGVVVRSNNSTTSYVGPHMMYFERATATTVTIHDPLRSGPVDVPVETAHRYYVTGGGQVGWGKGVYAGRGRVSGGSWDDSALGAQLRAIFAAMGLTDPAHRISATEAQEIGRRMGNVNLGHDLNSRTVGEVIATANAKLELPDIPAAITAASAQLGQAIGDAAVGAVINVAVVGSIIGLTYMGLRAILTSPLAIGRP